MPVEKLTGTLSEDTWGSWPDTGNRFSPQDVLNNPKKYRQEMKKILRADLSYPILMYKDELIDGYHRLAKAFMEKVPTIKVRFITDEQMAAAKKDETQ